MVIDWRAPLRAASWESSLESSRGKDLLLAQNLLGGSHTLGVSSAELCGRWTGCGSAVHPVALSEQFDFDLAESFLERCTADTLDINETLPVFPAVDFGVN